MPSDDVQVTTVRLPVALYEWLRREAYQTRRPQNEIVIDALAYWSANRPHLEAPAEVGR